MPIKKIKLTKGKFAIVDSDDFDRLSAYRWYFLSSGYAARRIGKKMILMHREILGISKFGREVQSDHINLNKLDNRKSNLRIATCSQNNANKDLGRVKGVSWHKQDQLWRARIGVNRGEIFLGLFKTKKEAGMAYDLAAIKYFGEFARGNYA